MFRSSSLMFLFTMYFLEYVTGLQANLANEDSFVEFI